MNVVSESKAAVVGDAVPAHVVSEGEFESVP